MTRKQQLKDFKSAVKQIASFKPEKAMSKPDKDPSAAELKQRWKLVRR